MKNIFITVRYDRLKNFYLKELCLNIIEHISTLDSDKMFLTDTFRRLNEQKVLLENLNEKILKVPQSAEITSLYNRLNGLISGLLMQIKSLKHAQFEEQKADLLLVEEFTRKQLENYIHVSRKTKKKKMRKLFAQLEKEIEFKDAYQRLGLMKFMDECQRTQFEADHLSDEREAESQRNPKAGVTLLSKEKIIDELRFFLKSIDMISKIHPEIDYSNLVDNINSLLIESRAYIRNLKTRREKAKEKLENCP